MYITQTTLLNIKDENLWNSQEHNSTKTGCRSGCHSGCLFCWDLSTKDCFSLSGGDEIKKEVDDSSSAQILDPDYADYMSGKKINSSNINSSNIQGVDLSDPKQLAEFAKYV